MNHSAPDAGSVIAAVIFKRSKAFPGAGSRSPVLIPVDVLAAASAGERARSARFRWCCGKPDAFIKDIYGFINKFM
jgi:hypothetical protein